MKIQHFKPIGLLILIASLLFTSLNVTPAYALGVPTPTDPADGVTTTVADTPPLGIPEFKWDAVAGATKYRLQISPDTAFTTFTVNITTTNTSYTPTSASAFSDGNYYWRVRVELPTVGDYSGIWMFTKEWASTNNAPTLLSPDDHSTLDFYDYPSFSWSPVPGASRYELQIYASTGGWGTLEYTKTTLATTHQPNLKLANGIHYWRVVPIDPGNRDGTPSDERSFTAGYNFVPTLLEPANFATPTFTPSFRWTAVRGAEFYTLQYSTNSDFSSPVTTVNTRNTSWTPPSTIPNDVNYYWRVRAVSGNSVSDWNPDVPPRRFIKKWYIKPVLLTPTNNYQHQRFPIFSWTPVPGASYYKVEIDNDPGFSPIYVEGTTENTFYTPTKYLGDALIYYWRVTPYDGNDNPGLVSDTASYFSYAESVAPHQVYPLYYYLPDTYTGFPGVTTNPHEDRTIPYPIFIWHRVLQPYGAINQGEVYPDAYRLQVSTDDHFGTVNWTVDTENTTAVPTTNPNNPFTPSINTDYFWRVRPLIGGIEVGEWSQVWRTRFNSSLGLIPTGGANPELIRPTNGFEFIESTPLLEWKPFSGATAYDVQISRNTTFSAIVDSATVSLPAYIPTQALAMRRLGDVDFGVYYWRVRKSPSGTWSEIRRFQIAAQSQYNFNRGFPSSSNRLQIGSDPASDTADPDYDVTSLQAAQDTDYWYFGFHVPATPSKSITYAFYLDLDHKDDYGAPSDKLGYTVTTIPAFHPEYAIYVLQEAESYDPSKVYIYHWLGSGWDTGNVLGSIGGGINLNGNYVELRIPNTAIGYQDSTGSYAISLFSLPAGGSGLPQDSVPSDPNVPGNGAISRFANVTERMNLVMPPNNAGVDPTTFPTVQPFFWDWSILTPHAGAYMKAYLDPLFTTEVDTYTLTQTSGTNYVMTSHAWADDFLGDNTYYWRVQPRYRLGTGSATPISGAWSQGWRFERKGFVPRNLQISVTFATPTFSWDIVEGAEYYELWVDDDPNFASAFKTTTKQNSYTDDGTFAKGTYYWRVRVRRHGGEYNGWSEVKTFNLTLPTPTNLDHLPAGVVGRAPTLTWTPVIEPASGDAVFAAWKYRVQVDNEPTFSGLYDYVDTEQSSWTPIKGYGDGTYYWRVAVYDGAGKIGAYSDYQTFTKQYPITTLVSPTSGSNQDTTPTFVWEHVDGAASYKLQVSKVSTFATTYDSITTPNTSFTPTKTYDNGVTYYWRVAIVDASGNIGPYNDATIILNPLGPTVVSSKRVNPNPTNRASVQFTVTFSENVTGVDKTDFSLTKTGTIVNASVTTASGTGKTYTVTVSTGTGNGTLRLNVLNNGTIKNAAHVPLNSAFTSGEVYTVNKVFLSRSVAAQDGWILETGQSTNKGGIKNPTATTLRLGDDAAKKQYRVILSFNTSTLPDNAVITKVTLKLKRQGIIGGGNPIITFQGFMADIRKGTFGTSVLQSTDWQTTASKTYGPFTPALTAGWYNISLTSAKVYINKLATSSGLTQIRLRFKLDDNNNGLANYLSLYSGNAGAVSSPQLIIEYYVP